MRDFGEFNWFHLKQAWNLDSAIKSASMTVWKVWKYVKYEDMKSMKIC